MATGWALTLAVYATTFHHLLGVMRYSFVIGLSCALAAFAAEAAGRGSRGRSVSASLVDIHLTPDRLANQTRLMERGYD